MLRSSGGLDVVSPSNHLGIKTTLLLRPLLLTPKAGLYVKVRLYHPKMALLCQRGAIFQNGSVRVMNWGECTISEIFVAASSCIIAGVVVAL